MTTTRGRESLVTIPLRGRRDSNQKRKSFTKDEKFWLLPLNGKALGSTVCSHFSGPPRPYPNHCNSFINSSSFVSKLRHLEKCLDVTQAFSLLPVVSKSGVKLVMSSETMLPHPSIQKGEKTVQGHDLS